MECNIIKDLLPLYIDGCCSKESEKVVEEHIRSCDECKKLFEDMKSPSDMMAVTEAPKRLSKVNDWKASVLQSVLLFVSFALITVGVALEAKTPSGLGNSFWALNLVIPATGFMLSLANWYFVRSYANRKNFSAASSLITLVITIGAYVWAAFHYELDVIGVLAERGIADKIEFINSLILYYGMGILLTVVFCTLSKILSDKYAQMLGKE